MINAGDLVRLKSGGPVMVVEGNFGAPKPSWFALPPLWGVHCRWFDGGVPRGEQFPEGLLETVK